MNTFPPLPKLEDVKAGIDELLLIDKWDKYKVRSSPKKFEKRFDELFTKKLGIMPYILLLSNTDLLPFKFYRLRKESKTFNERLISEYSFPPTSVVKNIQRANIPYHPVFYCSDNPLTAVFETQRIEKKDDFESFYYLSQWELRKNQDVRVCPFLFGNVDASNPYKSLSVISLYKIKEQLREYPVDEIEGFIAILKFLSHLFIYDNSYIVSSYIAHSNLYARHNLRSDIFIYPSYRTKQKTVNFAIHPNCVSENLLLKSVFKLRITNVDRVNDLASVKVSFVGKNENGIIYWQVLNDNTPEGKALVEELKDTFESS